MIMEGPALKSSLWQNWGCVAGTSEGHGTHDLILSHLGLQEESRWVRLWGLLGETKAGWVLPTWLSSLSWPFLVLGQNRLLSPVIAPGEQSSEATLFVLTPCGHQMVRRPQLEPFVGCANTSRLHFSRCRHFVSLVVPTQVHLPFPSHGHYPMGQLLLHGHSGHFAQYSLPPVISGVPPQQQLSSPSVHHCVPAPQFVPRCNTLLLSHLFWDTAVGRSGVSPAARAMVVALTGAARGCHPHLVHLAHWWHFLPTRVGVPGWSLGVFAQRFCGSGPPCVPPSEPRWHLSWAVGCVWAGVREAEATSVPALSPPWLVPGPSACFCRTSSSQQLFAEACGQLALPAPAIALQESGRFSRPLSVPPPLPSGFSSCACLSSGEGPHSTAAASEQAQG